MSSPIHVPLHDLHTEHGARFGEFAGYDMPMRYEDGAVSEHNWCRHRPPCLTSRTWVSSRFAAMTEPPPWNRLSLRPSKDSLSHEAGTRFSPTSRRRARRSDRHQPWRSPAALVVNAGTKHDDLAHLRATIGDHCEISDLQDKAIIALQGPQAVHVLAPLAPDLVELTFGYGCRRRHRWLGSVGVTLGIHRRGRIRTDRRAPPMLRVSRPHFSPTTEFGSPASPPATRSVSKPGFVCTGTNCPETSPDRSGIAVGHSKTKTDRRRIPR